jgi:hypothetical protein
MKELIGAALAEVCLLAALILYVRKWIIDYRFYKQNDWNFSKGVNRHQEKQVWTPDGGAPASNEARFKFHYPFAIIVLSILIVSLAIHAISKVGQL